MKLQEIDARGKSCPEPVILTKKGIQKNPDGIIVIVDNVTARENIKRFGSNSGYKVEIKQDNQDYILTLSR